jgi:hypothetical protein
MAATSTSSLTSSPSAALSVMPGWKPNEVTPSAVQTLFVKKLTEFVASYNERKQAKELKDLSTGPWYQNDYALACQQHKQTSRLDFLVKRNAFHHGFAPKGFSLVPNSKMLTGVEFCSYQLNKDCLPVDGLRSIQTGQFSLIECNGAIEIAMYETIHEIFGSVRFNEVFSATGRHPLAIGRNCLEGKPLYQLGILKEAMLDLKEPLLDLGDWVHFPNVPLYQNKHPQGDFGGLNTVCISSKEIALQEKKFVGFGTSVEGVTVDQMSDLLMAHFNEKPIDSSHLLSKELTEHFAIEAETFRCIFEASTGLPSIPEEPMSKEIFQDAIRQTTGGDQGFNPCVKRLDADRIRKLMTKTSAKASEKLQVPVTSSSSGRKTRGSRRGGRR